MAGGAMSILERAEKRRADFIAALARDTDNGLEELLKLYWWWGRDTADFFVEKFGQEHLEAEKKYFKSMIQTAVRDDVGQLPGLSKAQWRELDRLAATVSETAFEARLAEWSPNAVLIRPRCRSRNAGKPSSVWRNIKQRRTADR